MALPRREAPDAAALFFGSDEAKNKFSALAGVPKGMLDRIHADAWVDASLRFQRALQLDEEATATQGRAVQGRVFN